MMLSVLKEEPEDLTHLAPSGGDTCVPLPAFMPNLDDMFSFDYGQIPISTTDVLFTTASSVSEEQESNSGYEKKLISDEKRISSRSVGFSYYVFIFIFILDLLPFSSFISNIVIYH